MLKQDRKTEVTARADGNHISIKRVQPKLDLRSAIDNAQEGIYPPGYFYKPLHLIVQKSNICGCNCPGCGIRSTSDRAKGKELSDELALNLTRQAHRLGFIAYHGTFSGEPFDNMGFAEAELNEFRGKMDCYTINTNGSRFTSEKEAERLFVRLKSAGWTQTKFVLPFLAISIGMQQKTVPLENVVHGINAFRSVFSDDEATITITYYTTNLLYNNTLKELNALYRKMTDRDLQQDVIIKSDNIKFAGYAEHMAAEHFTHLPFEKLTTERNCFKQSYFTFIDPVLSVEADGTIRSCSCFGNYTHLHLGNAYDGASLREAIDNVNHSAFFRMISEGGTGKVFEKIKELEPEAEGILKDTKLTDRHQACLRLHQVINGFPRLKEFFESDSHACPPA